MTRAQTGIYSNYLYDNFQQNSCRAQTGIYRVYPPWALNKCTRVTRTSSSAYNAFYTYIYITHVSHVCHITDPTRVVFSGGAGANPVFVDAVRFHVQRLISRPPQVTASKLGHRAALIGAVSVALRSIRNNLVAQTLGGNRP